MTLFEKSRGRWPRCHGLSDLCHYRSGWARCDQNMDRSGCKSAPYMLMSDPTSLVPPQFSHWLQVRKVGAVYFFVYFYFFRVFYRNLALLPLCSLLLPLTVLLQKNILHLLEKVKFYKLPASNKHPLSRSKKFNQRPGQLIEFGIQLNFFNDNKTF